MSVVFPPAQQQVLLYDASGNPAVITGGNLQVVDAADGPVAPGTAASKSQLSAGQFNTAAPTLTNGQQAALQVDNAGNLKTTAGGPEQATYSGDVVKPFYRANRFGQSFVTTAGSDQTIVTGSSGKYIYICAIQVIVDTICFVTTGFPNGTDVAILFWDGPSASGNLLWYTRFFIPGSLPAISGFEYIEAATPSGYFFNCQTLGGNVVATINTSLTNGINAKISYGFTSQLF